MNNLANAASQEAKKQGLAYWDYMEKKHPGCVQHFIWGIKKETCKQKRERSGLENMLDRSNLPGMKMLSHMRGLTGKNNVFK